MSQFSRFAANCKIRHDFGDMIQVRYRHSDGQDYDTWVSGEEVLQRLRTMTAEERLRAIRRLDLRRLKEIGNNLPQEGEERIREELKQRLGNAVEDAIGGNPIGDRLADALRGAEDDDESDQAVEDRWTSLLKDDRFRAITLELAWIQLEGSFPESDSDREPDDWL